MNGAVSLVLAFAGWVLWRKVSFDVAIGVILGGHAVSYGWRMLFGPSAQNLFRVSPQGIEDQDFSFLIIGDPGEGDASQYSLVDSYLELGRRDDVKFLVISSDVIYPAGAMVDYESNFFMPFKGFKKPIYAIPGNHDWFDALEGFNANFLEPTAARAALAARVSADLDLTSTTSGRIVQLLERARQLREAYGTNIAHQNGPFFQIQTKDFALLAIDTGIQRTLDDRQRAWLADALERSKGKVHDGAHRPSQVLGWPRHELRRSGVFRTLRHAGSRRCTRHDGRRYARLRVLPAGSAAGDSRPPVHHFVNGGGGGAYLSIGGAIAWPRTPATQTWGFYPSPEAVRTKLDTETPTWKLPIWTWVKNFGAWPVSVETLSAMFDFYQAPFFQSFIEVRVERSKSRIVYALHGANGPIRWTDFHASNIKTLAPAGQSEFVAFHVELASRR